MISNIKISFLRCQRYSIYSKSRIKLSITNVTVLKLFPWSVTTSTSHQPTDRNSRIRQTNRYKTRDVRDNNRD